MVIKAVILTLKEETQGRERKCLKLRIKYDRSNTSESGWELEEKTFGVRLTYRGNICIPLMETRQSFSLIKSMCSLEKLGTKVTKNQRGDILQGRREQITECRMELEGTSTVWFLSVRINALLTLNKGIRKVLLLWRI